MAMRRINTPVTSSIGRLFDGISALMGICTHIEYEAQAAIELEALLQCALHMAQPFPPSRLWNQKAISKVDYRPLVHELISALTTRPLDLPELSRRFHSTIVEIITRSASVCLCTQSTASGIKRRVCNEFLLINALDRLHAAGFEAYCHQLVPTNDGGISLGQIAVASRLSQTSQTNNKETSIHNITNRAAAVLFDMDGVLIDSNEVIERAWREAADMYAKTISEDEIIKHIHGQPGPHTIRALFSDLPLVDQQKVQAHIIHVENTASYNPIPGVSGFITALDAAGVRVGIVTSGWRGENRPCDGDASGSVLHFRYC